MYGGLDCWRYGGTGGAAVGDGVCHCIGGFTASGDLLRDRDGIFDFGSGRIQNTDWRANWRVRGGGARNYLEIRVGRLVYVHDAGRADSGDYGRARGLFSPHGRDCGKFPHAELDRYGGGIYFACGDDYLREVFQADSGSHPGVLWGHGGCGDLSFTY